MVIASETTDSTACAGSDARPVRFEGHLCALLAQPEGEEGRLLESALRGGGFDVIPAEDGVAALEVICAVGPDVIVADLDHHDLVPLRRPRTVSMTWVTAVSDQGRSSTMLRPSGR